MTYKIGTILHCNIAANMKIVENEIQSSVINIKKNSKHSIIVAKICQTSDYFSRVGNSDNFGQS